MTARSRSTLKGYFNTGDKPTEGEFADFIDSMYHKDDLGWGEYADSQYTSASPLSLTGGVATLLNNDGVNAITDYEPLDLPLYDTDNRKIPGITGESRLVTIEFKIKPTNNTATSAEVWLDIGGAIGELTRRLFTFPKGSGVARSIVLTTSYYNLATWEANGAVPYIECDGPAEVYDIRYLIHRLSKVF
jgi:hypothetical protein